MKFETAIIEKKTFPLACLCRNIVSLTTLPSTGQRENNAFSVTLRTIFSIQKNIYLYLIFFSVKKINSFIHNKI